MRILQCMALVAMSIHAMGCPSQDPMGTTSDTTDTGGGGTTVDPSTTTVTITTTTGIDSTGSPESTTGTDGTTSGNTTDADDSTSESTGDGGPLGGGYGDCANPPETCHIDEGCLFTGFAGVCAAQGCDDVADCPSSELGGAAPVACQDVSGRGILECVLDCSGGDACPEGTFCLPLIGNTEICVWPVAPVGGGACPDVDLGSRVPELFMGDSTGLFDDVFPSCALGGGGADALVQWTAPDDGTFTFDTVGSGFDTVLAVLDGCGGPELACNDDTIGLDSEVTVDLLAGQSVILVVDSYDGDVGPFTLNVQ